MILISRKAHAHEAMRITPSLLENFEYADIIRGSEEDFETLFNLSDPGKVYLDKVKFYCPNFIYTRGPKGVELFTAQTHLHFDVPQIKPVSTIGAGDNFNAGLLYGILRKHFTQSIRKPFTGKMVRHYILRNRLLFRSM